MDHSLLKLFSDFRVTKLSSSAFYAPRSVHSRLIPTLSSTLAWNVLDPECSPALCFLLGLCPNPPPILCGFLPTPFNVMSPIPTDSVLASLHHLSGAPTLPYSVPLHLADRMWVTGVTETGTAFILFTTLYPKASACAECQVKLNCMTESKAWRPL